MPSMEGASLAGMYGGMYGQSIGIQEPLYYDALSAIPPASVTTMWNMGRVRRTILNNNTFAARNVNAGGIRQAIRNRDIRGVRNSFRPLGNTNAGGIRQTFSPFRAASLADVQNIDPQRFGTTRPSRSFPLMRGNKLPDGGYGPRDGYSPFNVLSRGGNWAARRAGLIDEGARAFAPGALGTMSTMATLSNTAMSERRIASTMAVANRFRMAGSSGAPGFIGNQLPSGNIASSALAGARFSDAKFTGRAVGYFQGAQSARMGSVASSRYAIEKFGGGYVTKGFDEAVGHFANSKGATRMAAKFAGSKGLALGLRAAPGVGWALLAADLGRFAGKTFGRGLRLGVEGIRSAQGDLIKPGPMQMGYQDNSIAATSRQRGVMAISNSRLNARSFLGQEGAYIHSAMG